MLSLNPLAAALSGVPVALMQPAAPPAPVIKLASNVVLAFSKSETVARLTEVAPLFATVIVQRTIAPGVFFGLLVPFTGSQIVVIVLVNVSWAAVGVMEAAIAQPIKGVSVPVQADGADVKEGPNSKLALLVPATPTEAACGVTLMVIVPAPPGAIPPVTLTVQVTSWPAATVPVAAQTTLVTPGPAAALLY